MAKVLFCVYVPAEEEDIQDDDRKKKSEKKKASLTDAEETSHVENGVSQIDEGKVEPKENREVSPLSSSDSEEKSTVTLMSDEKDEKTPYDMDKIEKKPDETENSKGDNVGDNAEASELTNDLKEKPNDEKNPPEFFRLISQEGSLLKKVKSALKQMKVSGVQCYLTEDDIYVCMFIDDDGVRCEDILDRLAFLSIGSIPRSSVSVFPASISAAQTGEVHKLQELLEKEKSLASAVSDFKKSIKARLVVAQMVEAVKSDAMFTFDYLMLVFLASLVAVMGLLESSSVVLVASMLISPLMGPILAGVFGTMISNTELLIIGCKSELNGLIFCILVGFVAGFLPAGLEAGGHDWRSSESWPTIEMSSRGAMRSLPVGILIAIPSGAGVAMSVLGGKVGSLVGVAISASLLPPAVNAGLLWANAILTAINPPAVVKSNIPMQILTVVNGTLSNSTRTSDPIGLSNISHTGDGLKCPSLFNNNYSPHYFCDMAVESFVLGLISLLLTIINIFCIVIMGVVVLKIKAVSRLSTDEQATFFAKDVKIARLSYETTKGQNSVLMRNKFLEEYKKIKSRVGCEDGEVDDRAEFQRILKDIEESPQVQGIYEQMPRKPRRWTYFDSMDTEERTYNTVHQERFNSEGTNEQLSHKAKTSMSADPVLVSEEQRHNVYFTVHRYIPPSELFNHSNRIMNSGRFQPTLLIPKASRFQIAKVDDPYAEDIKATEAKHQPSNVEILSVLNKESENLPLLNLS